MLKFKKMHEVLEAVGLLRSCYKDWIKIVAYYMVQSSPKTATLRSGLVVKEVPKPGNHFLAGLARLLCSGWSVVKTEENRITLSNSQGITFKCRSDSIYDVVDLFEIFEHKIYGMSFTGKAILDVGMYNGDSSIYFACNGAKIVIGLEPSSESFELALTNITLNNLHEKVVPLKLALDPKLEKAVLETSEQSPLAYFVQNSERNDVTPPQGKKQLVDTVTIQVLLNQFHLTNFDFIKMNCEGCEYGIIADLNPMALSQVGEVLIQYHRGSEPICQKLLDSGFEITYLTPKKTQGFLYAVNNGKNADRSPTSFRMSV
jgi:FkbM family methyltransferase